MQAKTSKRKSKGTRRTFLKSTGVVATGLYLGSPSGAKAAKVESLALNGGPKAVEKPPGGSPSRWPLYGPEEEKAVIQLVKNPSYSPIAALEKEWKEFTKVPYCKAQCNGTSALTAMFFALDLPPGSEIMVPSYTFFATIVPMRLFGLVPVFVDINPRTLNFDLEDAKKRLAKHKNVKAVLPVHWFGLPCEMDHICEWAKQKGLIVLEDSCHAHGASLKGKLMGLWGRMAAFSFQASKPLPAIEGGMANYQNREDYERGTTFGHYGIPSSFPKDSAYRKFQGTGLAIKTRMHPMAAALARCQLKGLKQRNAEGAAQIARLNTPLMELPGLYQQTYNRPDMDRLYYAMNMLFIDEAKAGMTRSAVVRALQAEGVPASAYSYRLQHKCALYSEAKWWHHKPVVPNLPGSEQANATAIGLPYLTSQVPGLVDQYIKAFQKVWAHRKELA